VLLVLTQPTGRYLLGFVGSAKATEKQQPGTNMLEMARPKLELPCFLSQYTKEDGVRPPVIMQEPVIRPPTPDGWSRVAAELLAASSSDGDDQVDEVDDMPLGASATTPCHIEVMPQPQQQPQSQTQQQQQRKQEQQQQQCVPRFFRDQSKGTIGATGSSPSKSTIADILCEESMAWEARLQDANTRLEEMKEQSEQQIRELELQVCRLALENTNFKKQLGLGAPESPRPSILHTSGVQSATVPQVSTFSVLPTPLRPTSRSATRARRTVEAIALNSASTELSRSRPQRMATRSLLSSSRVQQQDTTVVAAATLISSPRRAQTENPPRRQSLGGFSSEYPLCPILL